jgi:hypothetical protein
MAPTAETPGQLALLQHHAYPSEQAPCFSHLLISSTAPLEAERSHRRGIDWEGSADRLQRLRGHLREFFQRPGVGSGTQQLRLVVRIHGYNVPLPSVEREYAEAERKFQGDARKLAAAPPDDYVIFVHYAWPSERIGAGGPAGWFQAMPLALVLLLVLGGVLAVAAHGLAALTGLLFLGIALTLLLLRVLVYFRDRDRAGSFGVFDAAEMIRALHHLVQEACADTGYLQRLQRGEAGRISLSFLGHSMGTFVTTALIRVLSNVFAAEADSHLWEDNPLGPFAGPGCPAPENPAQQEQLRRQRAAIGELFILDRLILVAADIPVWAITTGRSNYLASCLRRFRDTVLFVNDADMVLRLASTLANYFVFPSGTRMGGYRLGNLSIAGRGRAGGYGWRRSGLADLHVHGALGTTPLCGPPFHCPPSIGYALNVIDCTDYTDQGRHLSALTAGHALGRPFNYAATLVMMLLAPLGIGRIDSHGGYFRGRFCLDLLYDLALRGVPADQKPAPEIQAELEQHCISWLSIPREPGGG